MGLCGGCNRRSKSADCRSRSDRGAAYWAKDCSGGRCMGVGEARGGEGTAVDKKGITQHVL